MPFAMKRCVAAVLAFIFVFLFVIASAAGGQSVSDIAFLTAYALRAAAFRQGLGEPEISPSALAHFTYSDMRSKRFPLIGEDKVIIDEGVTAGNIRDDAMHYVQMLAAYGGLISPLENEASVLAQGFDAAMAAGDTGLGLSGAYSAYMPFDAEGVKRMLDEYGAGVGRVPLVRNGTSAAFALTGYDDANAVWRVMTVSGETGETVEDTIPYGDDALRKCAQQVVFFDLKAKAAGTYAYRYDGCAGSLENTPDGCEAVPELTANTYTAERDEEIVGVGFFTCDDGTDYEIYAAKGDAIVPEELSAPDAEGTAVHTGYHTVELATPLALQQGDAFTIAVKLSRDGESAWTSCEFEAEHDDFTTKPNTAPGQSRIFCVDTGWHDLSAYGACARICAFTKRAAENPPDVPPDFPPDVPPRALAASIAANGSEIAADEAIVYEATAEGGAGGYKYSFTVTRAGESEPIVESGQLNCAAFGFMPMQTGVYTAGVTVCDADGETVYAACGENVSVVPPTVPEPEDGEKLCISSVSADKAAAYTGEALTWTATAEYENQPCECRYRFDVYVGERKVDGTNGYTDAASFTYIPTVTGNYTARVQAVDARGNVSAEHASLPVPVAAGAPSVVSVRLDSACSRVVGEPLVWTAAAVGGNAPYGYFFRVYRVRKKLVDGVNVKTDELVSESNVFHASAKYEYVPKKTGEYFVRAIARDFGECQSPELASDAVDVLPGALRIRSINADRTHAAAGDVISWSVECAGGSCDYTYDYIVLLDGREHRRISGDRSGRLSFTPSVRGGYVLRVTVSDAQGNSAEGECAETVEVEKAPLCDCLLSPDRTIAKTGECITWNAHTKGGAAPVKYKFSVYRAGVRVGGTDGYFEQSGFSFVPEREGMYIAKFSVRDADGAVSGEFPSVGVEVLGQLRMDAAEAAFASVLTGGRAVVRVSASGGRMPFAYEYALEYEGVLMGSDTSAYAGEVFEFTPDKPGLYAVRVRARDADGRVSEWMRSDEIRAVNKLLRATIAPDSTQTRVGVPVTWRVDALGGEAPLYYSYIVKKDGATVFTSGSVQKSEITFVPKERGVYAVQVDVVDAGGLCAGRAVSAGVTAAEPLCADGIFASPETPEAGARTRITAQARGGAAPYAYKYTVTEGGRTAAESAYIAGTFEFIPPREGEYEISVTVRDARGGEVTAKTALCVTKAAEKPEPGKPVINSLVSDAERALVGETLAWHAAADGGIAPYAYFFTLYRDGERVCGSEGFLETDEFEFTPDEPGCYCVRAIARDASGVVSAEATSADVAVRGCEPFSIYALMPNAVTEEGLLTIEWTAYATGGAGGAEYRFDIYCDGVRVAGTGGYTRSNAFAFAPMTAGSYAARVSARDAFGDECEAFSSMYTFAQNNDRTLAIASVRAGSREAKVGEEIVWSVEPVGGKAPYKYYYTLMCDDTVCARSVGYVECGEFSFVPARAGEHTLLVCVTDADGRSTGYRLGETVVVTGDAEGENAPETGEEPERALDIRSVKASGSRAHVGEGVAWRVRVAGGTAPYRYDYVLLCGGKVCESCGEAEDDRFSFTPTERGRYTLMVNVTDANGRSVSYQTKKEVLVLAKFDVRVSYTK